MAWVRSRKGVFGKGDSAGWYYGDIFYSLISGNQTTRNKFGDDYICVAVTDFVMWYMELKSTLWK